MVSTEIVWYEKEGDELIQSEPIELSHLDAVANLLGIEKDELTLYHYKIPDNIAEPLQEITGIKIDAEKYDYFIESSIDLDTLQNRKNAF